MSKTQNVTSTRVGGMTWRECNDLFEHFSCLEHCDHASICPDKYLYTVVVCWKRNISWNLCSKGNM